MLRFTYSSNLVIGYMKCVFFLNMCNSVIRLADALFNINLLLSSLICGLVS